MWRRCGLTGRTANRSRKDPAPLVLYRKMRWLMRRATSGSEKLHAALTAKNDGVYEEEDDDDDDEGREFEGIERQELLNEAYDSGYSAGFDAGVRSEAAARNQRASQTTYAESSKAGKQAGREPSSQHFLGSPGGAIGGADSTSLHWPSAEAAYVAGQRAERERVRVYLEGLARKTGHKTYVPGVCPGTEPVRDHPVAREQPTTSQPRAAPHLPAPPPAPQANGSAAAPEALPVRHDPQQSHVPDASIRDQVRRRKRDSDRVADARNPATVCVFCGIVLTQTSLFRHKKTHHAAELAAAGIELQQFPCWFPGCFWGTHNPVPSYLRIHLQRVHNYAHPGDPLFMTEKFKFVNRMPEKLKLAMISEYGQGLNAVKQRIKTLENEHRRKNPAYVSRHGLPNVNVTHETRATVLEKLRSDRSRQTMAVIELRQLARARGRRSQVRRDEGTWWEVADDLEAGLRPHGVLAQAVRALAPSEDEPTMPLPPGLLAPDAPDMSDPGWVPRHAPLADDPGDGGGGPEEDSVVLPAGTSIPTIKFEIVLPSPSRPTTAQQVQDDDLSGQSDEELRGLLDEINQRGDDTDYDEWNERDQDEADEQPRRKKTRQVTPIKAEVL